MKCFTTLSLHLHEHLQEPGVASTLPVKQNNQGKEFEQPGQGSCGYNVRIFNQDSLIPNPLLCAWHQGTTLVWAEHLERQMSTRYDISDSENQESDKTLSQIFKKTKVKGSQQSGIESAWGV